MVSVLTAREAVLRVQYYIQDQQGLEWTADEIVDAMGEALQSINTIKSLAGQYHDMDRLTLTSSQFTTVQSGWLEYTELPITVQRIVSIEGIASGGRVEVIEEGEVDTTKANLNATRRHTMWSFTGPGFPGSISITGYPQRYGSFRIWYIRRYPNLAYGTLTTGGTTTSAVLGADPDAGELELVDGVYTGLRIALEGTQGLTRQITGWTASSRTVSWASAIAAPVTSGNWSFCVPLAPEHTQLLVLKTAHLLATRAGNLNYMSANMDVLKYHEDQFKRSISARSTTTPRRRYSSRG